MLADALLAKSVRAALIPVNALPIANTIGSIICAAVIAATSNATA